MFNPFKKKQDKFIALLIEQSSLTFKGVETLQKYMKSHSHTLAEELTRIEKEADEVRRILIAELNRSFVTPIDREDIFALSRSIDDVVDYAYSTISEMDVLKVEPTTFMMRMSSLLKDATYELYIAMQRLEKHPEVAAEHSQRAKALESRVERVYREAIADIFSGPEDVHHVFEMLKRREVLRHLSNAADRVDEAANLIADIVVKTS
jgi:predicted phosphate transport protein (TIGR00153 family)